MGCPPGAQRQWSRLAAGTGSRCPRLWPQGPHILSCYATRSLNTQVESDPRIYRGWDGETEAWVEEDFPGWVIELVCWAAQEKSHILGGGRRLEKA